MHMPSFVKKVNRLRITNGTNTRTAKRIYWLAERPSDTQERLLHSLIIVIICFIWGSEISLVCSMFIVVFYPITDLAWKFFFSVFKSFRFFSRRWIDFLKMAVFWNVASCTSYWPTFRRSSLPPTWERSASAAPQKAASRLHAHRPENTQLTELVPVSLTESSRHASSARELVRVGTEQVSVTSYRSSWKSRDGKRGLLRKWTLLIREHAPPRPRKLLTTISTALAPKGAVDLKNCSRAVENFAKIYDNNASRSVLQL
jgi:hypothetical protein